jgi:hypothetical protein
LTSTFLVFFGLQRFADFTSGPTKLRLGVKLDGPGSWIILGHTWTDSGGINSPWVSDSREIENAQSMFHRSWGKDAILVETKFDREFEEFQGEESVQWPGHSSRMSTYRMMLSIQEAIKTLRRHPNFCEESTVFLTRSDFLPLADFPEMEPHPKYVYYPNLRRNGQFCDWLTRFSGSDIDCFSTVGDDYRRNAQNCRSYAGEDVLTHVISGRELTLRPFRWGGFLVRDRGLRDTRFGRYPRTRDYFPLWVFHEVRMRARLMLDLSYGASRRFAFRFINK